MENNTIFTRIQLKYDSYTNWTTNNPTLLEGEVAIAKLVTTNAVAPGETDTQAPVLFKVGPGAFNSLPWVSGLAADVYAWAKKATPDWNDFPVLPIEVIDPIDSDPNAGKFITDFTYTNNKLTITRSDVDWDDVQNKPDLALKSDIRTDEQIKSIAAAEINRLIKAADDEDDVVLENIANLVDYVEKNAGNIAQLITDVNTANTNASAAVETANSANATAGTANTTAGEAKELAQTALETAQEAEQNASNGATAAQASASAAAQSATAAGNAQTAAETARDEAVAAKNAAVDSNTSATAVANAAAEKANAAKTAADAATEAEAGLHNIAKTGNVNDLVQTEGDIIVFNCGTASTVI